MRRKVVHYSSGVRRYGFRRNQNPEFVASAASKIKVTRQYTKCQNTHCAIIPNAIISNLFPLIFSFSNPSTK